MVWREAIKSKLGTVYHRECIADRAHCDHRIRLLPSAIVISEPPVNHYYVCRRCLAIDAKLKKRAELGP